MQEGLKPFLEIPPLSMGQSAIPVALDKTTHTSVKAFCLAIMKGKNICPRHHSPSHPAKHFYRKSFTVLYSPSSKEEGENYPYPLPAISHKGKKNTSFIIVDILMRSD